MAASRTLLTAVAVILVIPASATAQIWRSQDAPEPLLVPVTASEPPYSAFAIWRAFSLDETPAREFRWPFQISACTGGGFLAREVHEYNPCFPALFTPWLEVDAATLADSQALARAVVQHSLAWYSLRLVADTTRTIPAVLAAVPGLSGVRRTVRLDTIVVSKGDSVRVRSVVLIPLPLDSLQLSEKLLINALPEVFGMEGELLAHDRSGAPHIRTDALLRLGRLTLLRVNRDTTLVLDAAVRTCGHLDCVAANPTLEWQVVGDKPGVSWFLRVVPDEGLLVESLETGPRSERDVPLFRTRELLPMNAARRVSTRVTAGRLTANPVLRVTWDDGVATVHLSSVRR